MESRPLLTHERDSARSLHEAVIKISADIIILGVVNIFKGMTILDVEHKWKVGYIIAIGILGGIAVVLEVITWSIVLKRRKTERQAYDGGHLPLAV